MFYCDKFKRIRREQKLTKAYIAKKLGVSPETVSSWELGRRNPGEKSVRQMADILEVNVQQISDLQPKESEVDTHPKDLSHFGSSWLDFCVDDGDKQLMDYISAMNKLRQINSDINQATVVIRALMASFHSVYYVKDINNKYLTANYAFLDMVGKDRKFKVAGNDDYALLSNPEGRRNKEEDETVLLTKEPIIKQKRTILKARRDKQTGLISKIPIFDRKGRTIGLVGVFTDITEIENKNRENQLLRNCIEQTPYVVWFGSSKDGTFLKLKVQFINSNVENLLGIPHKEYLKNPVCNDRVVIEKDKQKHIDFLYSEKYPKQIEYRIDHPERGVRWIESSTFKNEKIFFGFLRDVTLKKESTEFIEKMNSIWANTSNGIIIKKNAQIVNANQAVADLYEVPVVELKMWPLIWWEYIHEDDKNGENDPIGKISDALAEGKKRFDLNYRIKTKSGKIKYIEEHLYSTIIEGEEYWCCEIKDVTEKVEIETEKNILHFLLDDSPYIVWIENFSPNKGFYGNYHYLSGSIEKITGYNKSKFINDSKFWVSLVHPDDKGKFISWIKKTNFPRELNYRIKKSNGDIIIVKDKMFCKKMNGEQIVCGITTI